MSLYKFIRENWNCRGILSWEKSAKEIRYKNLSDTPDQEKAVRTPNFDIMMTTTNLPPDPLASRNLQQRILARPGASAWLGYCLFELLAASLPICQSGAAIVGLPTSSSTPHLYFFASL